MPPKPPLQATFRPGLSGSVRLDVGEADTAEALGSGDVPVLGTPRLVGLCEQASLAALGPAVSPDQTTVGMRVHVDHLAPTQVGGVVTAEATLEKVEGRKLTFTVTVRDRCSLVAAGRVTRVVVDRDRFLSKASG
ncbi:hotdog domain-containing protein [Iamia majanohamensis]|uniref:Hotdog domain-containing protein n=1 Tax=Iamia majanohamensis TaxID=467976 RepID=A0AAE9Y5P9_9ACTN|nr:hotdog domain-containing protein [Iamia majanohamensis]WCO65956.1 hotdog domain-containing protein [Iamia majanohamensis]